MGKLTDIELRKWIKAGAPVVKSDGGGLYFTMSVSQARERAGSWIVRYRFDGKGRELTLGRYPEITLAVARGLAMEARAKIQQGTDVAREKQQIRIERAAARSFRELANDYMAKNFPRLAESTVKQRRRYIEGPIAAKLGAIPAREVTTADVVSLLESTGSKSANVAEMVYSAVSEIFKHGLARHVVTANPCVGISVSAICGRPEPRRLRLKLTEAELRSMLPALPVIGEQNALAVKILLVTCTRIGELTRAEWSDVDLDRAEWFVPDENSKNGQGIVIPLPPSTVEWFRALQPFACGSRYVLPARQQRRKRAGEETHFEQRTMNAMLHKLCDHLGDKVRRFTPHDLRSTARSHLAALGVPILVAERCLNHSLGGLVAVYDQHDYLTERRAALELWASFLLACEQGREWASPGGKVVPLRGRAA
ncbi:site-specific integrase [Zoogloea sp. LCSB751]|uniref:tyrosine-type recombinase/integrase n=1 Tax=Zoogloea sp. LCSB751 TaxID=1965277 RepID=UPI0009A4C2B2|nr:site-specific integrase [Zoogloea sp. LCSB751]